MWGRIGCIAPDLSVEQWKYVLISGLNNGRMTWSLTKTHRAAGSTVQTGEAVSQSKNTAKKHLIFLFPLPTSFMCSGTSGTHKSKVSSQTLSSTVSTALSIEMSQSLLKNWAWAKKKNKNLHGKVSTVSIQTQCIFLSNLTGNFHKKMWKNRHFQPRLWCKYKSLGALELNHPKPFQSDAMKRLQKRRAQLYDKGMRASVTPWNHVETSGNV